MRKLLGIGLAAVLGLAVAPNAAQAAAITGILDFAGAVTVTNTGMILWDNPLSVQNTSTLMNGATLINSGTVTEKDLDAAVQTTDPDFAPLDQFQTLSADANIDFVLEDILSCAEIGGGTTCSAGAGSPFAFSQTALGTTVTLNMTGTVFDMTTPELVSTWVGIFTAQFPGQNIDSVLNDLLDGQIDTSFSASKFVVGPPSEVPEPASMMLLGSGLVGLAAARRRRNKK